MEIDNPRCNCINPSIPNSWCQVHGTSAQDLQCIAGLRAAPAGMIAASVTIGRVIEVDEPITLRPYAPKARLAEDIAHQACSCDMPHFYGHDTGCEMHPAPILADPLQMLVAATQLIPDQPTTEQWQTIKKAIIGLVPSPFRS